MTIRPEILDHWRELSAHLPADFDVEATARSRGAFTRARGVKNPGTLFRLALAYGALPEFQSRIREVIPVVGGAFLWRQAARSLVGLIPVWGIVPKVSVDRRPL